jgi:hypothetical protein
MGKRTELSGPELLCDLSVLRCDALICCTLSVVCESVGGMFGVGVCVVAPSTFDKHRTVPYVGSVVWDPARSRTAWYMFISVDSYAGDIVRDVDGRYRCLYVLVSVVKCGTVRVVWSGLVGVRGLWVEGGEVAALYGIKCDIG